jgi:hypothetical protein
MRNNDYGAVNARDMVRLGGLDFVGRGMEFGVFDHLDRTGSSLAEFYEDRLRIA